MQKVFYFTILFIISLLSYFIFIINDFAKSTDISLYPVKNANKQYKPYKTWLISYASHGVYIQNQNNLNMSASMTQAFDVIISYQPHHIEPEYYEKHKAILSLSRGAGYWLWKPYLILKTLQMMPDNDVLLYVDRSSIFRDNIYELLELSSLHDITLFPNAHTNRQYMKKLLIDKMLGSDDSIRDKMQLEGGFLLLRNTAKTRKFIKEWLHHSEDSELITDIASKNEYDDFIDHRHDQAILTALYYKQPERYNLYAPYPARTNAICVTKRHNPNYSLASLTFGKKLGGFNWPKKLQKYITLIGYQECM